MSCQWAAAIASALLIGWASPPAAARPAVQAGPAIATRPATDRWVQIDATQAGARLVVTRVTPRTRSGESRVIGPIGSVRPLTVAGVAIVDASGADANVPEAARLQVGDRIDARGSFRSGQLVARRIVRLQATDSTDVRLIGRIEAFDGTEGTYAVLGRDLHVSAGAIAQAETSEATGATPAIRLRRDPDDHGSGIRIGDQLLIGGRVVAGLDTISNPRLDAAAAPGRVELDSGLQVQASWKVHPRFEAFARVEGLQDVTRAGTTAWAPNSIGRVYEAFFLARRIGGLPIDVQVGRQRLRDAREWFFDESVDGVRLRLAVKGWQVESLIARSLFAGPEVDRARHDKQHTIVSVSKRVGRAARATGFLVQRNDRSQRDDDPTWIGATILSIGSPATRYWYTTAMRRGRARTTSLRGWAVDAGVSRRVLWPGRPTFTIGVARASGDDAPGDNVDRTFRQTGLEDNEGRFGGPGTKTFSYYGALFDPELSNVRILTAAASLWSDARTTLEVVYHRYDQVVARATLPSNALRSRALGTSARLGEEWDTILAVRIRPQVRFDLTVAIFRAGAAFGEVRPVAIKWRPQLRIWF